jgi:hypothetical protein
MDQQRRRVDQRRQASTATYANQRAISKAYGQTITPETVSNNTNPSEKDLEQKDLGIPSGIPKTTTVAPEADNHKESLHFFPNNQHVIVRLIKNRNKLPEGALTDDVLDTIYTTHDLRHFPLSYYSIKRFFFVQNSH